TDSFLTVLANDGTTVIETDDDDGPGLQAGSVVAGAVIPQFGNVFFQVNEFSDDDDIVPYRLYTQIVRSGDSAAEVEANDTPATATPVSATMMTGHVAPGSGDVDFYSFPVIAGERIVVMMDQDADDDGDNTDGDLFIVAPDGTTV